MNLIDNLKCKNLYFKEKYLGHLDSQKLKGDKAYKWSCSDLLIKVYSNSKINHITL